MNTPLHQRDSFGGWPRVGPRHGALIKYSVIRVLAMVVFTVALFIGVPPVQANDQTPLIVAQGSVGPEQAATAAKQATGGRVLSVSGPGGDGVYKVKVLMSGGLVKVMLVSASNGRVLN